MRWLPLAGQFAIANGLDDEMLLDRAKPVTPRDFVAPPHRRRGRARRRDAAFALPA
jgi:hypothetical protein